MTDNRCDEMRSMGAQLGHSARYIRPPRTEPSPASLQGSRTRRPSLRTTRWSETCRSSSEERPKSVRPSKTVTQPPFLPRVKRCRRIHSLPSVRRSHFQVGRRRFDPGCPPVRDTRVFQRFIKRASRIPDLYDVAVRSAKCSPRRSSDLPHGLTRSFSMRSRRSGSTATIAALQF